MINKQNLWFITLFSLILVLGIYYVTMQDEVFTTLDSIDAVTTVAEIEESSVLVALQVEDDEEVLNEINNYQNILLDDTATLEEKNDAYNGLQQLNSNKSECEKIKKGIKENFSLDSFIKLEGDTISITIASTEHDEAKANEIIRYVQTLYDKEKYITVKFE